LITDSDNTKKAKESELQTELEEAKTEIEALKKEVIKLQSK